MKVEAPTADVAQGSELVIRRTIFNISAGTKQNEQTARFPIESQYSQTRACEAGWNMSVSSNLEKQMQLEFQSQ